MKKVFVSLAFRLGLAISVSATVLLSGLGIYYSRRFNREIDSHMLVMAQIPGRLMNQHALPYSTARDRAALSDLVGETVRLAALCRPAGKIYLSTEPDLELTFVQKVPAFKGLDAVGVVSNAPMPCVARAGGGLMNVATPLYAEGRYLGRLYLSMETGNADRQKAKNSLGFFCGFFVCIVLVSLLGAWLIRRMTAPRLHKILACVDAVERGAYSVRVDPGPSLDELAELATGINHMAAQLEANKREQLEYDEQLRIASVESERANRCKSEFLANMSHEIRTPMNGVLGMAQILQTTELSSEQSECVAVINSAGKNLLKLINDILDLSRIELGRFELTVCPVNIRKLMDELCGMFMPAAREKGLKFLVDIDENIPIVKTDEGHLRQVLINLLGNALKFTSQGSLGLTVGCTRTSESECELLFAVSDTGIGIPEKLQQVIFQEFVQADGSHTREFGGTGLGLSISRNIVEKMGGDLTVSSTLGEGSVFRFGLHADEVSPEASPLPVEVPETALAPSALDLYVLVAEDNRVNQMVICKMLKSMGCRVDVASTGQAALDWLKLDAPADERPRYDMVLMDIQMPVLDGLAATAQIRASGIKIPVIALTAHAMKGDREKFMEQGMDGYLSKPVNQQELFVLLKGYSDVAATPA